MQDIETQITINMEILDKSLTSSINEVIEFNTSKNTKTKLESAATKNMLQNNFKKLDKPNLR